MSIVQLSFWDEETPFQPELPETEQEDAAEATNAAEAADIADESGNSAAAQPEKSIAYSDMCAAVLGRLALKNPSALACQVPVFRRRMIAGAAAAFYDGTERKKWNEPNETIVVEIFTDRAECLPQCGNNQTLLEKLNALEQEKLQMEANIRRDEPELKIVSDLFDDEHNSTFDYRASRIYPYLKLLDKIEQNRHALYRGSRLEGIRRAGVADWLYLAVPENMIAPHELAPGWGLWYVTDDFKCVEILPAVRQEEVSPAGRNNLALNIARAAMEQVLFANGVVVTQDNDVKLHIPPKRRRKLRNGE